MSRAKESPVARGLSVVLGAAFYVWLFSWLFFRPHGPYFWWWAFGLVFGGPLVAWVGFWVILYRRQVFKAFYAFIDGAGRRD